MPSFNNISLALLLTVRLVVCGDKSDPLVRSAEANIGATKDIQQPSASKQ